MGLTITVIGGRLNVATCAASPQAHRCSNFSTLAQAAALACAPVGSSGRRLDAARK